MLQDIIFKNQKPLNDTQGIIFKISRLLSIIKVDKIKDNCLSDEEEQKTFENFSFILQNNNVIPYNNMIEIFNKYNLLLDHKYANKYNYCEDKDKFLYELFSNMKIDNNSYNAILRTFLLNDLTTNEMKENYPLFYKFYSNIIIQYANSDISMLDLDNFKNVISNDKLSSIEKEVLLKHLFYRKKTLEKYTFDRLEGQLEVLVDIALDTNNLINSKLAKIYIVALTNSILRYKINANNKFDNIVNTTAYEKIEIYLKEMLSKDNVDEKEYDAFNQMIKIKRQFIRLSTEKVKKLEKK